MIDQHPPATSIREAQVKGTKIEGKVEFVRDSFGEAMLERVLDHLAPEERKSVRSLFPVAWYPNELYHRVLEAIVEVAGGGDAEILDRMGRDAASFQAEHSYGAYFRKKEPRWLLESMTSMHDQINRPGEIEIVEKGERRLHLLVHSPPTTTHACRVARAFYERALELASRSSARVEVVETACMAKGDEHCTFEVSW